MIGSYATSIMGAILFFSLFIPPTKFYLMLYSKRKTPLQHNGVIPILVGYLIFSSGKYGIPELRSLIPLKNSILVQCAKPIRRTKPLPFFEKERDIPRVLLENCHLLLLPT